MTTSLMWFRRDLRLHDNPAILAARDAGPDGVLGLFVVDNTLWTSHPTSRTAYLSRALRTLDDATGGLHIAHGNPVQQVVAAAKAIGASSVHIAADFGPYGARRDRHVQAALAEHGITLVRTGSPYAVAPGRVAKADGQGYRVFTPFYKAWLAHGWRAPAAPATDVAWLPPGPESQSLPDVGAPRGMTLPPADPASVMDAWRHFLANDVNDYATARDVPGDDRTSRMSPALRWGLVHPRTLLADLARVDSDGARAYERELAFREFYAHFLAQRPDSAFGYYNRTFEAMAYNEPGPDFDAWRDGMTGYPIVDAGMRQLKAEGWMHNRVRMLVASFLVKDLHLEWQHGARHFMDYLVDGDLASNQHGWQWAAGSGTDASPYFRIFNPTTQGKKFDPDGTYVRRWILELANVDARHMHTPWLLPAPPAGYPAPLVDHAEEREESLRRYAAIR
jgi:deoxyribodipyrimidine photo-lyase